MTNLNPPSRDPANDDSLIGTLKNTYKKFLQSTDDMLPAKVVAFDRATNRARVQPLIMVLGTDGGKTTRAQIDSLPVFQIGGGGFGLFFNLHPGDLGWIKANDRDISLFTQTYAEAKPNTLRLHTFSDAVFFPDVMIGYTISGEDADHCVLQNLSGTVRVAIWQDRVKITAPRTDIISPAINMTGNVVLTGNFTSVGTMTNNSKNVGSTSTHSGVQPGGGNTGPVV
jgi:hypothetical protein